VTRVTHTTAWLLVALALALGLGSPSAGAATPPPSASAKAAAEPAAPSEEGGGGNSDLLVPGIITGGLGAVGMVMFAVLGGMSDATYRDLEDQCANDACPRRLEADATAARSQQTIGNTSLVFGLIGLTAGGVMLAFAEWDIVGLLSGSDDSSEPPSATATLRVGLGSLSVTGRF
jgi:hypothetical protein